MLEEAAAGDAKPAVDLIVLEKKRARHPATGLAFSSVPLDAWPPCPVGPIAASMHARVPSACCRDRARTALVVVATPEEDGGRRGAQSPRLAREERRPRPPRPSC